jgi:hypothetical protein
MLPYWGATARKRARAHCASAFAVFALCLAPRSAMPAENTIHLVEQEIKAELLYNFMKYTDWPAGEAQESSAPMVICLFGGDPFNGRLQAMAGRTVNQHIIELRQLHTPDEAQMCSLVVIHADAKSQWPQLRIALADKALLTVSDFEGFADSGGMIEFTRIENRIGLKIGSAAVMAAHLQVQDRLMKLANTGRGGAGTR